MKNGQSVTSIDKTDAGIYFELIGKEQEITTIDQLGFI